MRTIVMVLVLAGCTHLPSGGLVLEPPVRSTQGARTFEVQRVKRLVGGMNIELEVESDTAFELPLAGVQIKGHTAQPCRAIEGSKVLSSRRLPAGRSRVQISCPNPDHYRARPGQSATVAPIQLVLPTTPEVVLTLADFEAEVPQWRQPAVRGFVTAMRMGGRVNGERSLVGMLDLDWHYRRAGWFGEFGGRMSFGQALQPIPGAHISAARQLLAGGVKGAVGRVFDGAHASGALLAGVEVSSECVGPECQRHTVPVRAYIEGRFGLRPGPTRYPRSRPMEGPQLAVTVARDLYTPADQIDGAGWMLSVGLVLYPPGGF